MLNHYLEIFNIKVFLLIYVETDQQLSNLVQNLITLPNILPTSRQALTVLVNQITYPSDLFKIM